MKSLNELDDITLGIMDMLEFNRNYTSEDVLEAALLHARWQTKIKKRNDEPYQGVPEITQAIAKYVREYLDENGYEICRKK